MACKRPDRLKLGQATLHVEYRDDLDDMGRYLSAKSVGDGRYTIQLRAGLDPDVMRATMLHEALHAIDHLYGLELSEPQVRVIEQTVMALLEQNPGVFA